MMSGKDECRDATLVGDIGVQALVGKQQHHHRGVPLIIHGLEARAGITALQGGSSPAAPAAWLAGERIESHPHVHVDPPRLKGQCHRPLRWCCAGECRVAILVGDVWVQALVGKQQRHY